MRFRFQNKFLNKDTTYENPQNAVANQLFSNTIQPNMRDVNAGEAKKSTPHVQRNGSAKENSEIQQNFYVQKLSSEEEITYSRNPDTNTNINYTEQEGSIKKLLAEYINIHTDSKIPDASLRNYKKLQSFEKNSSTSLLCARNFASKRSDSESEYHNLCTSTVKRNLEPFTFRL